MTPTEAKTLARAIMDEWQARYGQFDDELLTVDECARLLKVKKSWVQRHTADLPHVKVGGHVRYLRKQVLRQVLV